MKSPIAIDEKKKTCIIRLVGDGPYKGQYMLRQQCDGWLLVGSQESAHKMTKEIAESVRSRMSWNCQYIYGGKFEVVNLATPIRNIVGSRYSWNIIMAPGGRIPQHWFKKRVFANISTAFKTPTI